MLAKSIVSIVPLSVSPTPVISLMTSIAARHATVPATAPKTGNSRRQAVGATGDKQARQGETPGRIVVRLPSYSYMAHSTIGLDAATANRLNARARAAVEQLKEVAKADFNLKDALAKQQALTAERDAKIELVKLEAELDPSKRVAKRAEEVAILIQYRQQLLAVATAALASAEVDNKVVEEIGRAHV